MTARLRVAGDAALAALALVLSGGDGAACSCVPPGDAAQQIARSEQVAQGTVIAACRGPERPGTQGLIHFRIRIDWARNFDPGPEAALATTGVGSLCGLTYFVGETALFNLKGDGPVYGSSLCAQPMDARRVADGHPPAVSPSDDLPLCAE